MLKKLLSKLALQDILYKEHPLFWIPLLLGVFGTAFLLIFILAILPKNIKELIVFGIDFWSIGLLFVCLLASFEKSS